MITINEDKNSRFIHDQRVPSSQEKTVPPTPKITRSYTNLVVFIYSTPSPPNWENYTKLCQLKYKMKIRKSLFVYLWIRASFSVLSNYNSHKQPVSEDICSTHMCLTTCNDFKEGI